MYEVLTQSEELHASMSDPPGARMNCRMAPPGTQSALASVRHQPNTLAETGYTYES